MSQTKAQLIDNLVQPITGAAGSASAPTFSFTSDPNSGLYSPGADQLALSTGGTGQLFINSAGVITTDSGITSAQFNVVNTNSVSTYDRLLLIRNGSLTTAFFGLGLDSFYIASASGSPMVFCTNSDGGVTGSSVPTNERMRITTAGLVGIGNTDPDTDSATGAKNLVIGNANSSLAGITINTGTGSYQGRINFGRGPTDQSYGYILCDHYYGFLSIGVANSEHLRVLQSGKIGIGLSSPGALLHIRDSDDGTLGAAQFKVSKGVGDGAAPNTISRANCYIHLGGSEYDVTSSRGTDGGRYVIGFGFTNGETGTGIPAFIGFQETSTSGYTRGDLIFGTRNSEGSSDNPPVRMRLTPPGTLTLGGNTNPGQAGYFQIITNTSAQLDNDCAAYIQHEGSDWDLILDHTFSTAYWLQFKKNNSTTHGYVVQSGSGVNYYSASDYRLKANVKDLTGAIERLKKLSPKNYEWIKSPGITIDGFIAHEVQDIVPQAVDGEKDAVDEKGNPKYQCIDVAELVPLLTAALKEAVDKIEILEARLNAAGV